MPDILLRSSELYVEKVQAILEQPFDVITAQRLFPSLDESDGVIIKQLIHSLLDLVPRLGALTVAVTRFASRAQAQRSLLQSPVSKIPHRRVYELL